jgi:polysaccharide biosynthesis protein PslG
MRRSRHRLLLTVCALLAAGIVASATVASATEVGVNVTTTTAFSSPKALAAIRATRPAWVRVFLVWDQMEPQPGVYMTYQLKIYRRFFQALPKDTKIDVDVVGTPSWASGQSATTAPPTDDGTYATFLNYVVNFFNRRVTMWEIWNEESSPSWWTGTVAQYANLVKAAYPAIKAADPKATVILGANSPLMLSELYAQGVKNYFDGDAIHTDTACNVTSPYIYEYNRDTTTVNQYFFLGFTGTHRIMAANGDGSKPIFMTEIGWSSTDAECTTGLWAGKKLAGVSAATQAAYLTEAYHCLAQPQYSYVKAAMWFELYDAAPDSAPLDNYGLLTNDLSPKPAFNAFQQISLHGDQASGTCGNFAPPAITVLAPTPGQRYSGPLHIAVEATSATNGVREITIDLTGRSREHFGGKGFPATLHASLTWLGAKRLRPGPHKIKIVVIDKLGNVATKVLRIVHVALPPTLASHHTHRSRHR